MRVFLCAFTGFSLAIPIESISSLMLYDREAGEAVRRDGEKGDTYFSLPHLLDLPRETIRHGIVLKNSGGDEENTIEKNRNILLTTGVERETDIPEEDLYPMPRALKGTLFSSTFSGMQCASSAASGPVFVLNPESLVRQFI